MDRLIFFLLPLLAFVTGCPPVDSGQGHSPLTMPGAGAAGGDSQQFLLVLQVKVTSIEVPVGTASGSEEIWSYLDEERTKAFHSATLGRNGMRVGLADSASWQDLARILTKMTGHKLSEEAYTAVPGQPFPIELRSNLPAQTIFTSYSDRTLSGSDYPPGDNLLTLNITLDENDSSRMIVTALPQIRSTQRSTDIVRQESGFVFSEHPIMYNFSPAMFQFAMKDKDIVVIGPGAESRRPTSIGYHFLLQEKQNMPCETVLVLCINLFKVPLRDPIPNDRR
jgi:hypothetical protein